MLALALTLALARRPESKAALMPALVPALAQRTALARRLGRLQEPRATAQCHHRVQLMFLLPLLCLPHPQLMRGMLEPNPQD